MFNNALINFALRHLPHEKWNDFSSLCAGFTVPTIGSPIKFTYRNFYLEEFASRSLPSPLLERFLDFCYPPDIPDRQQQIECDRQLYWEDSSTLLAFSNRREIVGCIQVVPRNNGVKLPVEYASVIGGDGSITPLDVRRFIPCDNVTEIYRCRRSFNLNKMEAINVLLMLFKAVWAKTIQSSTAFSCISFDSSKADLRHMYMHKLAFVDPGISLTFGTDPRRWSLLIKDWEFHEKKYAALSKTHFYLQTWGRMSLKKRHLHLKPQRTKSQNIQKAQLITSGDILFAHSITAPKSQWRRKANPNRNKHAH